jgi:anti-sigma B factor antagonist
MTAETTTVEVQRLTAGASAIAIEGDVTSASEALLTEAYVRASADGVIVIVLDFAHLEYMNSGGIGLLVTLLIRVQREGRRLMAVGLNEHYRQILALTRLDEAIGIYETVAEALAAADAYAIQALRQENARPAL